MLYVRGPELYVHYVKCVGHDGVKREIVIDLVSENDEGVEQVVAKIQIHEEQAEEFKALVDRFYNWTKDGDDDKIQEYLKTRQLKREEGMEVH